VKHSLEKLLVIPTFMKQEFIVNKKFIVKDVAVLKKSIVHTLHFYESHAIEIFDKIGQVLRFLIECVSPWIAMGERDDPVQRGETPDHSCGTGRC